MLDHAESQAFHPGELVVCGFYDLRRKIAGLHAGLLLAGDAGVNMWEHRC